MSKEGKLKAPWMVAVWPGMGGVAISAGYYLMAKLGMRLLFEFPATDYFELEQIEVKDGLTLNRRLPRSRMFLWSDPAGRHDIIIFIGEAQPPAKGGAFCHRLIEQAKELGVEKVFTFAAMATQLRPKDPSRMNSNRNSTGSGFSTNSRTAFSICLRIAEDVDDRLTGWRCGWNLGP